LPSLALHCVSTRGTVLLLRATRPCGELRRAAAPPQNARYPTRSRHDPSVMMAAKALMGLGEDRHLACSGWCLPDAEGVPSRRGAATASPADLRPACFRAHAGDRMVTDSEVPAPQCARNPPRVGPRRARAGAHAHAPACLGRALAIPAKGAVVGRLVAASASPAGGHGLRCHSKGPAGRRGPEAGEGAGSLGACEPRALASSL
jgi:hypothetical protein